MKKIMALFLLAACGPLAAQEINPGSWKIETTLGANSAQQNAITQALKELENVPPEMRAMIKQQMSTMLGVDLNLDGAAPKITATVCISPEQAQAGPIQDGRRDGDCVYSNVKKSGNTWSGTMVCDGEDFQGEGEFTATIHDKKHYTSKATITGKQIGTNELSMSGEFLSPTCG